MMNQISGARSFLEDKGAPRKLMIVNGSAEILNLLDSVLDPGHYDVIFVETSDHAYSQIKRLQPNLVILCIRIEDLGGFQLLSMLKLDDETSQIPVLTYTTEYEGQDVDSRMSDEFDEDEDDSDEDVYQPIKRALSMN